MMDEVELRRNEALKSLPGSEGDIKPKGNIYQQKNERLLFSYYYRVLKIISVPNSNFV